MVELPTKGGYSNNCHENISRIDTGKIRYGDAKMTDIEMSCQLL